MEINKFEQVLLDIFELKCVLKRTFSYFFRILLVNILDKYYSTRGFYFGNEAPDFKDTLYERHGDPRHVGLSVRYDF